MEQSKEEKYFIDFCSCSGVHAKAGGKGKMALLDFIILKVFNSNNNKKKLIKILKI